MVFDFRGRSNHASQRIYLAVCRLSVRVSFDSTFLGRQVADIEHKSVVEEKACSIGNYELKMDLSPDFR